MADDRVMRHDRSDVTLVSLSGELDVSNVGSIERGLESAVEGAVNRCLIVDLSSVSFLDSSTVSLILRLQGHCREFNTALRLVAEPGSRAARVLEIAGADAIVPVAGSVDEAVGTLEAP